MKRISMNKLTVTLLMMICLFGQIKKGNYNLGGSVSYISMASETSHITAKGEITSFLFSPTIGYFVTDNISVNLSIQYNRISETSQVQTNFRTYDEYTEASDTFWLGIGSTYYFDMGDHKPYAGIKYGFNIWDNPNRTTRGFMFGIGDAIMMSKSVALKIGFSYKMINDNLGGFDFDGNDIVIDRNSLIFNIGFGIYL